MPAAVNIAVQVVVTAHVAPTATMLAPHAATPYVAPPPPPPPAEMDSAELQAQTGAVPLHVAAVAWHVQFDTAAAAAAAAAPMIGDSIGEHVVVTVHTPAPAVVPHAAPTVCVAPAVAATVSAGQ